MTEFMIETQNLTKRFGDLVAVDGLSIRVKAGTIHGFIGPNGAGKTTTMKMLIGALHPSGGSGTIGGFRMGSLGARKLLGFSPEHPKFYDGMKAMEYLVYMGRVSGLGFGDARKRSEELLRWLDLWEFSSKKVGGFSAGMRQKLSLAQAMIHEPRLLILDEPTANLDPASLRAVEAFIRAQEDTVVVVTQDLAFAARTCGRIVALDEGRVALDGPLDGILNRPAELERLGIDFSRPCDLCEKIREAAKSHGRN